MKGDASTSKTLKASGAKRALILKECIFETDLILIEKASISSQQGFFSTLSKQRLT